MNLSDQIEYRKVSGSASTTSQSFYSNKNVNVKSGSTTFDSVDSPMYYTEGGTKDYYGQDPQATFTSLNNPFIRFYFTANTHSISGDTEFVHRIYRLNYDVYGKYSTEFNKLNTITSNQTNSVKKRQITTQNGKSVTIDTIESSTNSSGLESMINTGITTIEQIVNLLENPYYEIVIPSSAMTFPTYDLIFPEFVKSDPNTTTASGYLEKLFTDKAQYFVQSFFRYKIPNDPTEFDYYKIYNNNEVDEFIDLVFYDSIFYPSYFSNLNESSFEQKVSSTYTISKYPSLSANSYEDKVADVSISSSTFSGITVQGGSNFFSYFVVPNKPTIENPILSGDTNTFSPKVLFSNVNDADEIVVEISYNVQDTGFTNSVVYNFPKNIQPDTGIQEATFSLKTNSNFIYRVGNVKQLKNVFDIKQRIVSYSNNWTGSTQVQPPSLFVFTQNDSNATTQIPIISNPPSILNQTPGNYTLILSVSGSTVTGATISILNPIGETISGTTDTLGNISFSGLVYGNHTVQTFYRGYKTHSQQISIGSNEELGYTIAMLWSNSYDTWATKANDRMGYDG